MARVSVWSVALLALLPPLAVAFALAWRGPAGRRFIAVQLAGSVSILVMAVMTFVFDQPSSIDLAVTFGVLGLPAALLYAACLERWL